VGSQSENVPRPAPERTLIQKAKRDHWTDFLITLDAQGIWAAKRLLAGRQPDRFPSFPDAMTPTEINNALLSHCFSNEHSTPTHSILRPFKDVFPLSLQEISTALSKSSNTSAPEPNLIPYGI